MESICKRFFTLFLTLALMPGLLGCGREAPPKKLWVVTEETEQNGMNEQAEQVAAVFEAAHPGFSVEIEKLPTEPTERELKLKQLRTAIMSGKGPDVFLLPSCNANEWGTTSWFRSEPRTAQEVLEPLFADPVLSMRNGLFYDIAPFYDADDNLGKDALEPTVMEAGTLNGGRYLLPLRYDFPVLFADVEAVEAMGLSLDELGRDAFSLLETAIQTGNQLFAAGAELTFARTGSGFSLLPPVFDYDAGKVTMDEEILVRLLKDIQKAEVLAAGDHNSRWDPYFGSYLDGTTAVVHEDGTLSFSPVNVFPRDIPITVNTLSVSPVCAAIAQAEEREFRMIPLRGFDGALTANVTYFGAVGAGCDYPEEAYEFLRRFLLEENQWEQNRSLHQDSSPVAWGLKKERQYHPIADGWAVRRTGSLEPLWASLRTQLMHPVGPSVPGGDSRRKKLLGAVLTEDDVPILHTTIDRVTFGNTLEQDLAETIRALGNDFTGEATEVDVSQLAQELTQKLRYQLMEG